MSVPPESLSAVFDGNDDECCTVFSAQPVHQTAVD